MEVTAEDLGKRSFCEAVMRARLPKAVFKELKKTIDYGAPLDAAIADSVAIAMREWAKELGATHYTHWFHPLTNLTAEKHDSFMDPVGDGTFITEFTGKELIKAEPDGSSFPSGGIRETCAARGYTVWDCTSPAFVKEIPDGCKVLCIPTIFISYTGESLDHKTPLLRSMDAVNKQALRILKLFGKTPAKVTASVGPEQEYFLIDKDKFNQRLDLKLTGRTLFGAPAPKGQELDDQYFGVIKDKVSHFMRELNKDLWEYGIPAKTQHNEVAPSQHEIAPIYGTTNVATDQNQLLMETLKKVAEIVEKYNLWIISDEIHCDLIRQGRKHIPMAKVMKNYKKLITAMAPSKTFNMAGLQYSNIIIRDPALRSIFKDRDKLFGMINPLSLAAAKAAYDYGDPWLDALKTYLDQNFAFVKDFLTKEMPEAVLNVPEATYLAWVDVSRCLPGVDDLPSFFAYKAGVLLEGGSPMFVGNADGYVRLNLAMPRSILKTGLERMRDAINKYNETEKGEEK